MSHFLVNRWFHFSILFFLLLISVVLSDSQHEVRKRLQYSVFDQFNRLYPRPPTDQIAIIDLDEESIAKLGQWPWPRTIMADLVTNLKSMGADVIAFDIVFAEPDRTSPTYLIDNIAGDLSEDLKTHLQNMPDHDQVFADAIKEAGNVVTGFTRATPKDTLRPPTLRRQIKITKDAKKDLQMHLFFATGIAPNLPQLSKSASGNGSFMATPDVDGILRQVSPLVLYSKTGERDKGQVYPMLGIEALRVATDSRSFNAVQQILNKGPFETDYFLVIADQYQIPMDADGKVWVYYRDIGEDEYISAWKVLDQTEKESIAAKIKNKIVFIGTSAEGLRDIRSTPLDIFVPGVEVHVNFVEQVLQGKYLLRPDVIKGAEAFFILIMGLAIILLAPFIGMGAMIFIALLSISGMFYGSWWAYVHKGLLLDPVYASGAVLLLTFVSSLFTYLRSEIERKQVREAFGLYVSPDFMEELAANPDKLKLGGEVKDLTVMFTDIRSFTTISESLTPEQLIQLMNDFLTPMSDLVMNNRGTIDKYMGDAMMAFWNAPLDDPDHARHACLAALGMNKALVPINEHVKQQCEMEKRPFVPLNAGIGINTGPCSVGNMGSKQRFAYSALGDGVNLASRLEGQTKAYGVNILVGEDTIASIPDFATLELDLIQVKGKTEPARIFTLLGDQNIANNSGYLALKTNHQAFLDSYRTSNFQKAAKLIETILEQDHLGLSGYYKMMLDRVREYQNTPPHKNWGGIYIATSK